MNRYNPTEIEPKWQKIWEQTKLYEVSNASDGEKEYILEYFPYPSGATMHVGHVRNYTIGDVMSRFERMKGKQVLHPMGWDSFGLPAENYAIKNNITPREAIDINTGKFKQQLMRMGFSYDWSREVDSSDPSFYKWTQWFFLLLFKKGLAYQKESLQWWCDTDKTVLANEQVEDGKCWRCDSIVSKKPLKQWFFKITDYADRLIDDLEDLDWSNSIKQAQTNWIGRSYGSEIDFQVKGTDSVIKIFTTRADTLFGASFMVLAPEHSLSLGISTDDQKNEVVQYIEATNKKSEVERMEQDRVKTGVFTGAYAINPVNNESVPIYIADYVLAGYGTGAIMAVPAHDMRDHEFAEKYQLDIRDVVKSDQAADDANELYTGEGELINSGDYDGLLSSVAREKIVEDLAKKSLAKVQTNYKLRDWLISRQRYWGAPIPIIHCQDCGPVAVPESELPVKLPELENWQPDGTGSPLARDKSWLEVDCPDCGKESRRETDTMDGFACSSWYFLRYADPLNAEAAFDPGEVEKWAPVDSYIGGAEHAVMHLLYARMWTKVMYDDGLITFNEPFKALRNQGMIQAPDGRKMSKSKGNTISPDELIDSGYGADAVRIMEMFLGPWDQAVNWSTEGMAGCFRYLNRVWVLAEAVVEAENPHEISNEDALMLDISRNKVVKSVTDDFARLSYNTVIAKLMKYTNELYKVPEEQRTSLAMKNSVSTLLQLLAPFAPHIAEELWQELGNEESIHISSWPLWDEELTKDELITLVVQINGKLKGEIQIAAGLEQDQVLEAVKADSKISKLIENLDIKREIVVKDRLVNFVV